MSRIRAVGRGTVVLVVTAVLVAGVVVVIKAADGAYSGHYQVVGRFTAAGQGLHPGSEVDYRGVQVGQVTSISLVNRAASVVLSLNPPFRFPANGTATIQPQNLFGAENVNISSPTGRSGPWLAPGASIRYTAVSSQLTSLFAAADPLFKQIDTTDLSSTLSELNQATNGTGPQIASGFSEGAKLATLLSSTLGAQLTALDSLTALTSALVPSGQALNSVSAQANAALPAINQAESSFQNLLDSLTPLSENVAQFLSLYHPDIAALLTAGANVTRVLLVHQTNIEQLVHGLYRYVYKFATGAGETLPSGSKLAYFQAFILFSDVNSLVCNLIAPAAAGLSALAPLQQALASSGSPFNCSAQMSTFNTLNPTSTPSAASTTPTGHSTSTSQQASNVAGQVYQALGTPQTPTSQSLGGFMSMLLGGL